MPSSTLDHKAVKRPDELSVILKNFFNQLAKNVRALTVLAALLVVAGAGAAYIYNQKELKSEAAKDQLYQARNKITEVIETKAKAQAPAEKGAPVPALKLNVDQDLSAGVKSLEEVAAKYPGTRAGYEAQLALGDLYYDYNEPAKASDWFQKAVSSAPSSLDRAMAMLSQGYAYENAGKLNEAAQTYEKARQQGEGIVAADILRAQARVAEAQGKKDQAKGFQDALTQLEQGKKAKQ